MDAELRRIADVPDWMKKSHLSERAWTGLITARDKFGLELSIESLEKVPDSWFLWKIRNFGRVSLRNLRFELKFAKDKP